MQKNAQSLFIYACLYTRTHEYFFTTTRVYANFTDSFHGNKIPHKGTSERFFGICKFFWCKTIWYYIIGLCSVIRGMLDLSYQEVTSIFSIFP